MNLLPILTDLRAAGVVTIALDPLAVKVRWQAPAALPDALRARVAAHKVELLALAGDAPLVATPDDLVKLASPPPLVADGVPVGYTITEHPEWLHPGWRVDGPDGYKTVATSFARGASLARQHAAAADEI
jgi:hypothetical protein